MDEFAEAMNGLTRAVDFALEVGLEPEEIHGIVEDALPAENDGVVRQPKPPKKKGKFA